MARAGQNVDKARERLRLKSEQLNLRVKIDENKQKLRQVSAQLKTVGGRIR